MEYIKWFLQYFYKKTYIKVEKIDAVEGYKSIFDVWIYRLRLVYGYGNTTKWVTKMRYDYCLKRYVPDLVQEMTYGLVSKYETVAEPEYKYVKAYNGQINNKITIYTGNDHIQETLICMNKICLLKDNITIYTYLSLFSVIKTSDSNYFVNLNDYYLLNISIALGISLGSLVGILILGNSYILEKINS